VKLMNFWEQVTSLCIQRVKYVIPHFWANWRRQPGGVSDTWPALAFCRQL
jgi:hypothetical protein